MGFFEWANYVEAVVWVAMAGFCAARAVRRRSGRLLGLAVALVMFGVSDLVEVRTGAWYRPWWLLVWKGVCVVAILAMLIPHLRESLKLNGVRGPSKRHGKS